MDWFNNEKLQDVVSRVARRYTRFYLHKWEDRQQPTVYRLNVYKCVGYRNTLKECFTGEYYMGEYSSKKLLKKTPSKDLTKFYAVFAKLLARKLYEELRLLLVTSTKVRVSVKNNRLKIKFEPRSEIEQRVLLMSKSITEKEYIDRLCS